MEFADAIAIRRELECEHSHVKTMAGTIGVFLPQSEECRHRKAEVMRVGSEIFFDQGNGENIVPGGNGGVGRKNMTR